MTTHPHRRSTAAPALIACAASCACALPALGQYTPPAAVIGKEYITAPNTNALGVPVTGQTVGWTALGPAFDSFVYGAGDLDAMAHMGDAYFEGLMDDTAALVVSLSTSLFPGGPTGDPSIGAAPISLFYRNSSPYGPFGGAWATAPMLNPMAPPTQVTGVELHGAAGDTTHWSEVGDPGGVSISTVAGPYLLTMEIETAIGATLPIDVDAFMVLDHALSTELFHVGDYALMSVRANGEFDGGEIWLLHRTPGGVLAADFFVHGGVTWDTANDVGPLFGLTSAVQEIDALEAFIPAPGAGIIAGLAMLAAGSRRRG